MDVVMLLKVGHATGNLCRYIDGLRQLQRPTLPSQTQQQAAMLHQLCDDIDWFLFSAHTMKLDEVLVVNLMSRTSLW